MSITENAGEVAPQLLPKPYIQSNEDLRSYTNFPSISQSRTRFQKILATGLRDDCSTRSQKQHLCQEPPTTDSRRTPIPVYNLPSVPWQKWDFALPVPPTNTLQWYLSTEQAHFRRPNNNTSTCTSTQGHKIMSVSLCFPLFTWKKIKKKVGKQVGPMA